ncbi:peptidylprolyl isomerase [Thioflexithrix psekupsensis]|uniref:peptidylprolyl isomerase n=1 Tax=Thioflexithrix psekupsensis TaxID=1570016 RepID=UPI0026DA4D90
MIFWRVLFVVYLSLSFSLSYADNPKVVMQTSMGDIVLALDAEKSPKTVENFLRYVDEGFYAGTIFHRVIDGFMIQGGGYGEDFAEKETHDPVMNEADNGLKNLRGTIAMARTPDPHSATAQFFINVKDNTFLDHQAKTAQGWGYTVFGQVIEGMEVVDAIKTTPTGSGGPFRTDVPETTVVIHRVQRVEAADKAETATAPASKSTAAPETQQ